MLRLFFTASRKFNDGLSSKNKTLALGATRAFSKTINIHLGRKILNFEAKKIDGNNSRETFFNFRASINACFLSLVFARSPGGNAAV